MDTSLIEEWERLRHPEAMVDEGEECVEVREVPLTRKREAFLRLVRHEVFAFLKRTESNTGPVIRLKRA